MADFIFHQLAARQAPAFNTRRVYRWAYRDPALGHVAQSKPMAPDEALALDIGARIIPGSEVVIEERPSDRGTPLWL